MRKNKSKIGGIAKLAVGAGLLTYGINKAAFHQAVKGDLLRRAKTSCYSWRYGNIYYTKTGQGAPLLMIHSMDAFASSYEWHEISDTLSKYYTLYMIDLPGFGRSDRNHEVYTSFLYAKAIKDFCVDMQLNPIAVLTSGASSSAVLTGLAYEKEAYASRVIMINPESFDDMIAPENQNNINLSKLMKLPLVGTFSYVVETSRPMLMRRFKEDYFANSYLIKKEMVDAMLEAAHLGGEQARFGEVSRKAGYTKNNVSDALRKIQGQLYLIRGENVPGSEKNADIYKHFAPSLKDYTIPGTKLMPHMEKPEVISELVLDILREV